MRPFSFGPISFVLGKSEGRPKKEINDSTGTYGNALYVLWERSAPFSQLHYFF